MTFRNPNGLWILLGIPVLIALFLLHRKYRDVVLPSSHIWRLMQQRQKSNRLKSRLWQLVMLLLQILAVVMLALLAARPLFTFGSAENRIYILDTSASMRMASPDGVSRFDRAKEDILLDASRQPGGSSFTLLTTDPDAPLLLESTGNTAELKNSLNAAVCSWVEQTPDCALTLCREMLRSLPEASVLLYTDHDNTGSGISVIDLSRSEENCSVLGLKEVPSAIGRSFTSTVISWSRDADVTLALYADDVLCSAQNVSCPAGKAVSVSWSLPQLNDYSSVRVWITQDDALLQDNEATVFSAQDYEAKVAVISASPFYWEKALSSLESVSVTVFGPESAPEDGFDLYLYDGTVPDVLPGDGMCLMADPEAPQPETDAVFGEMKNGGYLSGNNTNPLLADMRCGSIAVRSYRQVTDCPGAEKLLFRSSDPVYLRGTTGDGRAWGYIMFSLQDSNLPMLPEFILLLKHLVRDLCPILCPVSQPEAGCDTVLQPLHNCTGLRGTAPDGSVFSIDYSGTAVFRSDEPGICTLTQYSTRGTLQSMVQVRVPQSECDSRGATTALSLPQAGGTNTRDGAGMSLQTVFAALFLLLMLTEGMVYRHERI